MIPPRGFDPERLDTWPRVDGRLEYVDGKLWFMPPCADEQQDTVADVVITLGQWVRAHCDFVLGTNEAGMSLGGSTRAADAAVWRRQDVGAYRGRLRSVPPVLAVEVAGEDEDEAALLAKAPWYLEHGVLCIWLVLPSQRCVVVVTADRTSRHQGGEPLPAHPSLPSLDVEARQLFIQLGER
jgi:Uma2 family endonuclease